MDTCPLSFIPLSRWHLIVASIFALHNETRMCSFYSECPVVADVFVLLSKHPHTSYPPFVMDEQYDLFFLQLLDTFRISGCHRRSHSRIHHLCTLHSLQQRRVAHHGGVCSP
jgi:hypothetical protein